jgi:hypothetical protein
MSDRDALLKAYLDAAGALAAEGLNQLDTKKVLLVHAAMERGAEMILVHAAGSGSVILALHPPGGADADPVELCRLELCGTEASHASGGTH